MTSLIPAAKITALLACAFMCAAIGGAALDARVVLNQVQTEVKGVTDKAGLELDALKTATDTVASSAVQTMSAAQGTVKLLNKSLKPLLDGLVPIEVGLAPIEAGLAEDVETAGKVAKDARLSLDNVNKAAVDERLYFEQDLPPLMAKIQTDIVDAGDTLTAAKALIANDDLKRILKNSGEITASGAAIAKDGQDKVHQWMHPTKAQGFVGGFEATGDVMKHWWPSLF